MLDTQIDFSKYSTVLLTWVPFLLNTLEVVIEKQAGMKNNIPVYLNVLNYWRQIFSGEYILDIVSADLQFKQVLLVSCFSLNVISSNYSAITTL